MARFSEGMENLGAFPCFPGKLNKKVCTVLQKIYVGIQIVTFSEKRTTKFVKHSDNFR